jgi:proton-translocating NADH-quinone oxidoreductase chain N
MLPLFILVPLATLILVSLPLGRWTRIGAAAGALAIAVFQSAAAVAWPRWLASPDGALERFLALGLAPGEASLSRVLLLSIGIVAAASLVVSWSLLESPRERFHFASVILIALTGMNGVVLVGDFFSLYVFLEVTTVCSFILIAMRRGLASLEGAFKYIMLSAVATTLMLGAIALLMMMAGSTSFAAAQAALGARGKGVLAKIAVGAFACGLFVKGGIVPFHGWLPAAYSTAPAPVSILLAGIVTKVSGIYALLRLFGAIVPAGQNAGLPPVFGGEGAMGRALLFVGAVSIVVGALAAIGQKDLKRLLAYSSISQVGYIILGLGCAAAVCSREPASPIASLAFAGAVFHLFNHSIFKSLLFVNSAALEQRLGTTEMARMGGLGSRMPVTGVTNVIALLSTAGVPPLAGFWSKFIIIVALWQAGFHSYAAVAVLFSAVTLGYLLIMQRKVFFGLLPEGLSQVREAGGGVTLAAVALAALTIGVGLLAPYLLGTFLLPVTRIL